MNKTQIFLIVSLFSALSFLVGHKIGDSRGYEDGFNEGYRYDCKDEIASIYEQVKAEKKIIEHLGTYSRSLAAENHLIKNSERYKQKRELYYAELKKLDTLRKKYEADSVKYYKLARKHDDSLAVLTGFKGLIRADGSVDTTLCNLWSKDLGGLSECQPGWHLSRVQKRSKKSKRK